MFDEYVDNYCGYIEFGEGEKLLGIIGHLDVVLSGDGWDTPPFMATIKDGKIFGRGAIDDKSIIKKRKNGLLWDLALMLIFHVFMLKQYMN